MTVDMLAGRARAGRAVILAALAALLLPLLAVPGAMPARASSCGLTGAGDASSPFLVETAADLALVGVTCGLDKDYRQTANITLGGSNHTPIGVDELSPFVGTFDGGRFTITGLRIIDEDVRYGGLFGAVRGGTLTNIRLVDVVIDIEGYAGGLAGSVVETTIADSTVKGGSVTAEESAGGLVAIVFESFISNSHTAVDVTVTGDEPRASGLAGEVALSIIVDSSATGDVTSTDDGVEFDEGGEIGGLVGFLDDDSDVVRSFATGDVSA